MQLKGNILITGGTGSLGTAILQRVKEENWDADITIVARNETKMNATRKRFPFVRCEVGDIRDKDHLTTLFRGQDIVIHAAAIKIVPVAESNPREAVLTNVVGSMNVAQAANQTGVTKVIGISTDKSCGPTYYGLTKRLMEGLFREARTRNRTDFVCCRYGNVLKSANSVVPLFERQIKENRSFTITDFNMTRFWLSMKQAVDIILFTLLFADNGDIVVPKAPAMSVLDLAKTLDPNREAVEIGIRPGERLTEALLVPEETLHTYDIHHKEHGKYFIIKPPDADMGDLVSIADLYGYEYSYRSDNADHYLAPEEMKQLLRDS